MRVNALVALRRIRETQRNVVMPQSERISVALNLPATLASEDLVGKDAREILQRRLWRDDLDRTAIVDLVMGADLAIITGMALPNRTLLRLMQLAKQYKTSTMIWAITGRNLGRYYVEHGASSPTLRRSCSCPARPPWPSTAAR